MRLARRTHREQRAYFPRTRRRCGSRGGRPDARSCREEAASSEPRAHGGPLRLGNHRRRCLRPAAATVLPGESDGQLILDEFRERWQRRDRYVCPPDDRHHARELVDVDVLRPCSGTVSELNQHAEFRRELELERKRLVVLRQRRRDEPLLDDSRPQAGEQSLQRGEPGRLQPHRPGQEPSRAEHVRRRCALRFLRVLRHLRA